MVTIRLLGIEVVHALVMIDPPSPTNDSTIESEEIVSFFVEPLQSPVYFPSVVTAVSLSLQVLVLRFGFLIGFHTSKYW
jgi:hypothetical protein